MILTQSLHLSCLDCRQTYIHSVSAPYPCISIITNENCLNDANNSPTHFQFRSNLQLHSHEDDIIRGSSGVRLAIPIYAHHADQLGHAIPSITVHEQHLLTPGSYISSRARICRLFYESFSPTSVFSSPLHILSGVNCPLTIRFLAHRSAKFDLHPQVRL